MAEKHGMTSTYGGRCPALVRSSGKYWCGLVLNAEGQEKAVLAHALKIADNGISMRGKGERDYYDIART